MSGMIARNIKDILFSLLLVTLVISVSFASEATEQQPNVYTEIAIADVAETLDLLGLPYQLEPVAGEGIVADTRLVVLDKMTWFLYGYNCSGQQQKCSELQMRAVIQRTVSDEKRPDLLNTWNRNSRFVRAYTSVSSKAVILEMDIYLAGGVALGNITDQFLLWRQSLSEFTEYLEQE
ncbi:MAG: YbjN domain-containing protein [Robiginitomaculum sp.]|nr:YbjN domain-containing protein [Robiginitomaculum sp.]